MSITTVWFFPFPENNYVEEITEKLISHPQRVTAHEYAPEFLCVQDTKIVNK